MSGDWISKTPLRRGRLTPAELDAIARLAHLTSGQIGMRIKRHPSTINFAMKTRGLKAPVEREFAYTRGGYLVRSFSPSEDARILALRADGETLPNIAAVITNEFGHRRTAPTIGTRLRMLASRDEHQSGLTP